MSLRLNNSIFIVDSHTAGCPARVVVGGLPKIRGRTVAEKRDCLRNEMDYVRTFLNLEPRGHSGMCCALLVEPSDPDARFGVIICSSEGYADVSGHTTIAVATVLVETGMVQCEEPWTTIILEEAVGPIQAKVRVENGKVKFVSLMSVPAFLYQEDFALEVPGYGTVRGDIAFGGNWFFYVKAEQVGVRVRSEGIDDLMKAGSAITNELAKLPGFVHPSKPEALSKIFRVILMDSPKKHKDAHECNINIPLKCFDRSPCGTGTMGRMAVLHAKNKLKLDEVFINESITGEVFRGRLLKEIKLGSYKAVIPEITGNAYITGFNHLVLDPEDPFGASGFAIGKPI